MKLINIYKSSFEFTYSFKNYLSKTVAKWLFHCISIIINQIICVSAVGFRAY